ncbi:hypothetical protein [Escherichia phage vB_EcoP_LHP]
MAKQQETEVQVIHRLSPEAYAQLEKLLPQATAPTDGTRAAYQLGVQYVLQVLRQGFVA